MSIIMPVRMTDMRRDVAAIFNAVLSAIDLAVSVKKHGRRDDLAMTGPTNTNVMDLADDPRQIKELGNACRHSKGNPKRSHR